MIDTKGYCFSYDISLPLEQFYEIVAATEKHVGDLATLVCGFGHLGDSNLHLNVFCSEFSQETKKIVEDFVYGYTRTLEGSVSAEHGEIISGIWRGYRFKEAFSRYRILEKQILETFKEQGSNSADATA